jgi:hypothetical protein
MDKLIIEGSSDKPTVTLDKEKGYLFIGGSSLPENVLEVYSPVLNWLDMYISFPNPVTRVEFFFEYLNTASSHMVMRVFHKVTELQRVCEKLSITWFYPEGDLDMRHFGEELAEITHFQLKIIARDLNT